MGGLDEIGKNITAIEYGDEIIIIDCGLAFPDEDMYGVDLVIPYILKQINIPIYGTNLTIGLVKNKLIEHNIIDDCKLNVVNSKDIIKFKNISVEFINVTHIIADACALGINTPLGTILHTGDFKIDYTPIDDRITDLNRISELGKNGILLLMADSTNVERKGHSLSEKTIGEALIKLISSANGRVIVATFASNIHRMQQIADASIIHNRKIAFSGKSMENISKLAIELGYLHIPEEFILNIEEINEYNNNYR